MTLDVACARRLLRLSIIDDGTGMAVKTPVNGSGLRNMKHRAAKIAGSVHIESREGQGTLVRIEIPIT